MNTVWLWFWEAVVVGCVLWYTTATIYIAVRGAADIRGMLAHLKDEQENTRTDPK
jgi:hypothetical protein